MIVRDAESIVNSFHIGSSLNNIRPITISFTSILSGKKTNNLKNTLLLSKADGNKNRKLGEIMLKVE